MTGLEAAHDGRRGLHERCDLGLCLASGAPALGHLATKRHACFRVGHERGGGRPGRRLSSPPPRRRPRLRLGCQGTIERRGFDASRDEINIVVGPARVQVELEAARAANTALQERPRQIAEHEARTAALHEH